jgi:hypothetical protein
MERSLRTEGHDASNFQRLPARRGGICNNTLFCPKDAGGKTWIEWKADYDYSFIVKGDAEFDVDLGQAAEPRQDKAWKQGVWRRKFEKGIALVNPKGNGKQTVTLDGSYQKISGTQDPSVNDGSTVTSVTLEERDGLILLGG